MDRNEKRIRFHAERLVNQFFAGNAIIDNTTQPDILRFRFRDEDLDPCPEELRHWAKNIATNNIQLFHYHSFCWLAKGIEPPGNVVKEYCERYITLRKQMDNKA